MNHHTVAGNSDQPGEGNSLFPVFLKLDRLSLLIIGGGHLAIKKLQAVLQNCPNARIRIVAPEIADEIRALASGYANISLLERSYEPDDMNDSDIVINSVKDQLICEQVRQDAKQKGKLVNASHAPDQCDFFLPSIVQNGSFKVAISTNGRSPAVASRLNEVIGELIAKEQRNADEENELLYDNDDFENGNQLPAPVNGTTTGSALMDDDVVDPDTGIADEQPAKKRWKKIAAYSTAAFALMLIGHFIFSYIIPLGYISERVADYYPELDKNFHWMVLAGFTAQLVDGALGMGYGVTSAAILLSTGNQPRGYQR
jgi:siroheme synthase-like protein